MVYPLEKRGFAKAALGSSYDGIYKNEIEVAKNIKRASVNNARKILYYKMSVDPDFRKNAIDAMKTTRYGINALHLFKTNPKLFYDRFNQALATPQFQNRGIHKDFYSALEKRGYNAILDINDSRYSGYKGISKNPTIFFGKDVVNKIGSTKLSDINIDANARKYTTELLAKKEGAKIAGYAAAYAAIKNIKDLKAVESYLDKHPDSELSKKEILINQKKHKL